jgi:hypothetical protein
MLKISGMKRPPKMLPRNNAGSFEDAVENGFYLLATKASLPSSESFTDWLKKNCQLSERTAYKKMECAEIHRKDPKAKFDSERAALASVGRKQPAVPRPNKQQGLVQAIAARLFKLEKTDQAEALFHAATPEAPAPRKEIERHVIAWTSLLREHGLTK